MSTSPTAGAHPLLASGGIVIVPDVLVRTGLAADWRDDADAAVVGHELAVMLGLVIDPADKERLGRLLHQRIRRGNGGFHLADHRGTRLRLARVSLLACGEVELLATQQRRSHLESDGHVTELFEYRPRIGVR